MCNYGRNSEIAKIIMRQSESRNVAVFATGKIGVGKLVTIKKQVKELMSKHGKEIIALLTIIESDKCEKPTEPSFDLKRGSDYTLNTTHLDTKLSEAILALSPRERLINFATAESNTAAPALIERNVMKNYCSGFI